ncbi:ASCH domain-containing protein [Candidatus Berkelbacteria bacterium]|nr:ASCH domain-containing protein [Candidatus Berkelbacteria bacterium]
MARHLAIFVGDAIEKIFRGEKVVEARLSATKLPPFGLVHRGDEIYLKKAGGQIVGRAAVENVLYFDHLTAEMVGKLRREYHHEVAMTDQFWREKSHARYATLIFLEKPQRFVAPLAYRKRDRRSWLVLDHRLHPVA